MFITNTHSDLLFFTTKGRVFQLMAQEIPQTSRTAKGTAIVNFLQLMSKEQVTSILPLDKIANQKYLFFTTEKGVVKKVSLDLFSKVRRSGLIAIKIKDEDRLIWAKPTSGNDEVILITANVQAIRFKERDIIAISANGQVIRLPFTSINKTGRDTQGVRLMRLKNDDDSVAGVTWV
jgi:DNA gyrase subunit A